MKSFLKSTGIILAFAIAFIACDSNPSLQKYYVDSKENNEFISVDLPASILELKDSEVTQEIKDVLATIEKVNFLAFQITETNKDLFDSEKAKVKEILKNPKYKQLMRMNLGDGNVSVNYLGEENAIDEVIIFGADNKKGFAVVRVIGENMNPTDIIKLSQEIKLDGSSGQLKQLEGLLGSIQ